MSVAGLLLAAGAGRRFGGPKAVAHGGRWLQDGVAALVGGGCFPVRVVLGAQAQRAIRLLPNPELALVASDWRDGMSASLKTGLWAANEFRPLPDAVLVHLVDLPDIGPDVVARVVAACAGPDSLARAVYQNRPGHPVLLGRSHWPAVVRAVHGDAGARTWLDTREDVVPIECSDLAHGRDVDRQPNR